MASGEILFIDGFDHYDTAQRTYKWDTGGTGFSITTSPKRTGRAALQRSSTLSNSLQKNLGTTAYNITVGFASYYSTLSALDYGFEFGNSTGTQCTVAFLDTGAVRFFRGTALETLVATSDAGKILEDQWQYIQIAIHSHQTLGSYRVMVDGELVLSGEAVDTCAESAAGISSFIIKGYTSYVDDLYILSGEEFLGDMQVDTIYPTAAGNYTQWTPSGEASNWECVSDDVWNSGEYLVSSGESHIDTYTFGNLTALEVDNINAIQITGSTYKPGSGTEAISLFTRIGSSDYSGEYKYLPGSYKMHKLIYNENPDDSEQWKIADVNAAEFGIKREDV